jgi:hypothetical protein
MILPTTPNLTIANNIALIAINIMDNDNIAKCRPNQKNI